MSEPKLIALLDGVVVGEVFQDPNARYRFVYNDDWRAAAESFPLSLSMPLAAAEHGHKSVEAFLWGLLPDSERTLDRYARTFGVSARNPIALLTHIGADCAGAVQFVPPDRVHELVGTPLTDDVAWIDDADIAQALRSVKETGLGGNTRQTLGQFSLAGAQPKIALYSNGRRWGRPLGRTPTTHILKPPSADYAGFAENEHLCLALAAELGLGAARTAVQSFEGETAIVVERFDRRVRGDVYRRVHQEDLCQALSVLPWRKYESEGGPGVGAIVPLIQEMSSAPETDVGRFIDMVALNWVLAATDAHAKNFAFLLAAGGAVRLAPFYDMASFLPYTDSRLFDVKLAMRIGTEYQVRRVVKADWMKLAEQSKVAARYVLERVEALVARVPEAVSRVGSTAIADGLKRDVIEPLVEAVQARSVACSGQKG
jgi:serine/threonine-protein kinase HipA